MAARSDLDWETNVFTPALSALFDIKKSDDVPISLMLALNADEIEYYQSYDFVEAGLTYYKSHPLLAGRGRRIARHFKENPNINRFFSRYMPGVDTNKTRASECNSYELFHLASDFLQAASVWQRDYEAMNHIYKITPKQEKIMIDYIRQMLTLAKAVPRKN
jgi:hypothetical protein